MRDPKCLQLRNISCDGIVRKIETWQYEGGVTCSCPGSDKSRDQGSDCGDPGGVDWLHHRKGLKSIVGQQTK